jgi:hypothetical protein
MFKWTEKDQGKKIAFRRLYGRKPTRAEIKLLKRNLIDLQGSGYRPQLSPMNIQDQLTAKHIRSEHRSSSCKDV